MENYINRSQEHIISREKREPLIGLISHILLPCRRPLLSGFAGHPVYKSEEQIILSFKKEGTQVSIGELINPTSLKLSQLPMQVVEVGLFGTTNCAYIDGNLRFSDNPVTPQLISWNPSTFSDHQITIGKPTTLPLQITLSSSYPQFYVNETFSMSLGEVHEIRVRARFSASRRRFPNRHTHRA